MLHLVNHKNEFYCKVVEIEDYFKLRKTHLCMNKYKVRFSRVDKIMLEFSDLQ